VSLSKREIGLLGLLVLVGLMYLAAHFLYQPFNLQQQQLQVENGRLVQELEGWEAGIALKDDQAREDSASREEYQQQLAKVPPLPVISDVIDFLELSARETQVKLLSIDYKESAEPQNSLNPENPPAASLDAQPINFKITVSGTHFNLLSLLLKIENAPRLYIIKGIKMTLSPTDGAPAAPAANRPITEANQNTTSAGESAVPESLLFNPDLSILEIDFNAFYECPQSNLSTQS
jgi:hypothetical protein